MVGLPSLCSVHGDPHLFVSGKSSCRENRMKTHRTSSGFDYESNASMNDLVVENWAGAEEAHKEGFANRGVY